MYKKILHNFHKGCADYRLLADGDRVLVALSGGKDSMLLARLLAEQSRVHKPQIVVAAAHVVMDNIPYDPDRSHLQRFCDELAIPFEVIHTRFDDSLTDAETGEARTGKDRRRHKTKCFLCAWYRRKALFQYATEHGFNKIALGHHQDDIITTWLMNVTFVGSTDTMRPAVPMRHYPLTLIRPLCLVREAWIQDFASNAGLTHQKTPCPYETHSRRTDAADLFRQMEALNPEARHSLWRAMGLASD